MATTDALAPDLKPLPDGVSGKKRYAYTCVDCGKEATNSYIEPTGSRILEARICFFCDCNRQREKQLERDHHRMTIIGGRVYGPGNRTSGSFRGMAGRRFDIEYIEPSKHAGKRITTFDLWAGSPLTDDQQKRWPDTARFLGNATEANAGGTTCWNPSDGKPEPFMKPAMLDLA